MKIEKVDNFLREKVVSPVHSSIESTSLWLKQFHWASVEDFLRVNLFSPIHSSLDATSLWVKRLPWSSMDNFLRVHIWNPVLASYDTTSLWLKRSVPSLIEHVKQNPAVKASWTSATRLIEHVKEHPPIYGTGSEMFVRLPYLADPIAMDVFLFSTSTLAIQMYMFLDYRAQKRLLNGTDGPSKADLPDAAKTKSTVDVGLDKTIQKCKEEPKEKQKSLANGDSDKREFSGVPDDSNSTPVKERSKNVTVRKVVKKAGKIGKATKKQFRALMGKGKDRPDASNSVDDSSLARDLDFLENQSTDDASLASSSLPPRSPSKTRMHSPRKSLNKIRKSLLGKMNHPHKDAKSNVEDQENLKPAKRRFSFGGTKKPKSTSKVELEALSNTMN